MADYPTRDGNTNIIIPAPGFKPGPNSLPNGGTNGQVLKKTSDNDFDMAWEDEAAGGGGAVDSVNGQVGVVVLDAADVGAVDAADVGVAGGVAELDGSGKVPSSQLPALALTDVYVVNSEVAQLALAAQEGDVAVRTDLNKSFIHNGGVAGTMADWQEMLTPTDLVISVNGQTGAVTLSTTHVGEGTNLYFTNERAVDAVGGVMVDTSTIHVTYNDPSDTITYDVVYQMSITADSSGLRLINDSASPGNDKLYGTNSLGQKGWYDQPAGGGGGVTMLFPETIDGWCIVHSDYNAGTTPAITSGQTSGTGANGGSAYTTNDAVTLARCGVFSISTGTTTTGRAARTSSTTANLGFKTGVEYKFGAGLRLEDAPDATEDYYVFVGFKQSASADPRSATSCGLYYDRGYTNWQTLSYLGGAATYTDTGVAFAADAWFDLGVRVTGNDTAGSVTAECYINGTSVGTITGVQNVSSLWTYNHEIKKLAGTTARLMYVDYEYLLSRRA
jgi:hypothetical protein